jgi:RNA polymerase sigma-70 factor (ECF subfamily)
VRGGAGAHSTPAAPSSPDDSTSPPDDARATRPTSPSSGSVAATGGQTDSDAGLLAAHVAGDPNAFATLVHRHQNRLWATALRMMRNPHDAADALQDAYLAAFRRADGFRGESQVTTWLHRIVVNACLDRLRKLQRLRSEQPLPEDPDRTEQLVADTAADPVEQRELRADLAAALTELSDDQRAALVLVDIEGYGVEEAASILGVPPGTVKSRCARGRARLARTLRARRGDPGWGES